MTSSSHAQTRRSLSPRGFTLLEMLVVVGILSVVAGAVVSSLDDIQTSTAEKVVHSELLEIKKALLRFRNDTGVFPGEGPFALIGDGIGQVDPAHFDPGGNAAVGAARFRSPAAMYQLMNEPVDSGGDAILPWNPDTRRGWRGPYIGRVGAGLVVIADLAPGQDPETWNAEANPLVVGVLALKDRFPADPTAFGVFAWQSVVGATETPKSGRPYLLFDLDGQDARVVSLGRDGRYQGALSSAESAGSDDLLLFLRQ